MTYVNLLLHNGQVVSVQGVQTAKYAAKEVATALGQDPDLPLYMACQDESGDWYGIDYDTLMVELAEKYEEPIMVIVGPAP